MMQDKKGLQAGTSHFLGQNFARASEIKYQTAEETEEYAWTTSWGASTRLIGGLIMSHGDDDGIILPPKVAPSHVVLMPIIRKPEDRMQVMTYVERLETIDVTMTVPEEVIEQAMEQMPKLDPKERIKDSTAEVELGFDEETAKRECARCLRCDVNLD